MVDESNFLQAILANSNDNTLRLIYADWLEERGDPRGLFLRWEVALHTSLPKQRTPKQREHLHRIRQNLDPLWVAQVERPLEGWRIFRTRPEPKIQGRAIPAFIHNGNYFLTTIDVYADGAINCWGFVDLPLFRNKLAQRWIVTQAVVGGNLSIHNLGMARVAAMEWEHAPADMDREVTDAVRELNPTGEGLLDMQGTDTEFRNGVRTAKMGFGDGKPYRISIEGNDIAGDKLPVFEVVQDGYRLQHWFIYADGFSQLGYATRLVPLETVGRMFDAGQLTLSVPEGAWVTLDGLGRFQAGVGWWGIEPRERLREAFDLLDGLNGGKGSIRNCIDAHRAYESNPSPNNREALRQAYEAVPEHLRIYCGDMDSKDGPIRRILYSGLASKKGKVTLE